MEREEVLEDISVGFLILWEIWKNPAFSPKFAKTQSKTRENEFGILGFQVAGRKFNLYVLIKDDEDISRLFLLRSIEIPTQDNKKTVLEFVEALLLLRKQRIIDLETENAEIPELKKKLLRV
ncbi:633_t:CDS:2 [Paraglomus occultum]|uniref:633_t:CDS:1 n=1 Tax=Paraglomus occultum TaxID=144539 RepID=A0A9N9FZB2_9GLOM|nr:633_t:CDS:2 [Paraglomus occultum]